MLDLMYEIPSREDISKVIISGDVIKGAKKPRIVNKKEEKTA